MKVSPEKGKPKHWYDCPCRFSLRHILFLFIFLLFLVIINLLASSSKLSLVLDVSMRMKSDVLDVLNNFVDLNQAESINGTFRITSVRDEDRESRDNDLKTRLDGVQNGGVERELHDKSVNEDTRLNINPKWYFRDHPFNQSERTKEVSNNIDINIPQTRNRHFRNFSKKFAKFPNRNELEPLEKVRKLNNAETNESDLDSSLQSGGTWRKDSCDTCFQHDFNYVIDNPDICKLTSPTDTVDVLILILTVHNNIQARNALRDTWLSPYRNNTGTIRHVFLLGETREPELRERVRAENDEHRDIIKEDFIDTYMNLTYKSIMGFKWASTKCAHARFVLKTDDDMYVNTNNLLQVVNKHNSTLQTAIGGSCNLKARPIRNKKSKWYASVPSYPNPHYPGFCSGTGYVTSMSVAGKIYEISPSVPFFHLEDVYVALCVRKLGLSLRPIPGFNTGRPKLDPCNYKGPKLVTAHQLSPLMLQMVWRRSCTLQYGNRALSLVKRRARP